MRILAANLSAASADPVHLQQVLLNLIMNSLEAMHETPLPNRRILISTAVPMDLSSSASVIVASVSPGKILRKFSRIFTPPNQTEWGWV